MHKTCPRSAPSWLGVPTDRMSVDRGASGGNTAGQVGLAKALEVA